MLPTETQEDHVVAHTEPEVSDGPSGDAAVLPTIALVFIILMIVSIVALDSMVATIIGAIAAAAMSGAIGVYLSRLTNDEANPGH